MAQCGEGCRADAGGASWVGDEEDDHSEDHQVGIEKQKNAGVEEGPFALHAAEGFAHAPQRDDEHERLPGGAVQVLNVREASKMKAHEERAEREGEGAEQRLLPQTEDGREREHGPYNCRASELLRGQLHLTE